MGWTSYHAKYYKNGSVDRKRECDSILDCETYSVLKSIMHGSVYYAAVQKIKRYLGNDENDEPMYESIPANSRRVFAVIIITAVQNKEYFNFSYKDMDETMEPFYYDCPESILKLLSPTDDEYALRWRKKCRELAAHKKTLSMLSEGTVIEFISPYDMTSGIKEGDTVRLTKCMGWKEYWSDGKFRWKNSIIPLGFKVLPTNHQEEKIENEK